MFKLQSLKVINDVNRISSLDVFRGAAVLLVIFFHFNNFIPWGFLGVDLFFVISGLLIGGILIREMKAEQSVHFLKFFLSRGFKIWPSFYLFVFLSFWINQRDFDFQSIGKYLFFYQNYTGESSHLWSICVEEHFYFLLPLLFVMISFFPIKNHIRFLYISVISLIAAGILFKFASYYLTTSSDTFSATHNRIDSLAWGVLLSLIISENPIRKVSLTVFSLGILIFVSSLLMAFEYVYFTDLILHSIIPFSFFLMLFGLYAYHFNGWKGLKFFSYYSYNLYLWHPIVGGLILQSMGASNWTFFIFLPLSLLFAMTATILVEEKFLDKRKGVMNYLFKKSTIDSEKIN